MGLFGFVCWSGVQYVVVFFVDVFQKFKLGFQEVDMVFFIFQQFFEDCYGDIIVFILVNVVGFFVRSVGVIFVGEIIFQYFFDVLVDFQWGYFLYVWVVFKEDDVVGQFVCMLYFFD